jgi:hypothetical protein
MRLEGKMGFSLRFWYLEEQSASWMLARTGEGELLGSD